MRWENYDNGLKWCTWRFIFFYFFFETKQSENSPWDTNKGRSWSVKCTWCFILDWDFVPSCNPNLIIDKIQNEGKINPSAIEHDSSQDLNTTILLIIGDGLTWLKINKITFHRDWVGRLLVLNLKLQASNFSRIIWWHK